MAVGFNRLRADVSGSPAPWDDYWYQPIGIPSSVGMKISPDTVKRIAAVLACVGKIGRSMISLPPKIYTDAPGGGKKIATNHPLNYILTVAPNAQQTPADFFQMLQWHLELRGNAYAEIVPGARGAVDQLIPLHPDRVHVDRIKPSGRLLYKYNDPLTGNTRTLVQEEVFHIKNASDDGVMGQSTVAMGCDVFGVALAAQDYAARFFANDATPPGVIESAGKFRTKEDEDEFLASFQRAQTGKNRHKTALLPPGLSYKAIGVTPNDAQNLDSRKYSRIEIASLFDMPPHMIGETEKAATYASVEQFAIMFAVNCLLPRVIIWEQTIQRDLIQDEQYYVKFSLAAILRGDMAARYAAYQIGIQNGWLCQDDVRLLEDLNPIEDGTGKTYWRPLNWAPLAQIEPPAAPGAAGGNAPSDETGTGETADDPAATNAQAGRLKLLASSAAERCVRKEMSALRKLAERRATAEEFRGFYAEHANFIAEVLNIPLAQAHSFSTWRLNFISDHDSYAMPSQADAIAVLTDFAIKGATS
jgi:HK97 family phage portal protein